MFNPSQLLADFSFIVKPPQQYSDLMQVVYAVANYAYIIAVPIAVIIIIYGGVKFALARGNQAEVDKAKSILKWSVVGLIILTIGAGFVALINDLLMLTQ